MRTPPTAGSAPGARGAPSGPVRREDWPERLAALIAKRLRARFRWGRHDCVSFACEAAMELTGQDPWAAFRGTYADEAGAERILAEYGPGLEALCEGLLGRFGCGSVTPPLLAQRGDLALVPSGNQLTLGVVLGAEGVAAPGLRGLAFVPLGLATRAWSI